MPPKPNYAKQMANGIEQNVEMYGPIKRVFLSDKILDRWKEEIGAYLAFISCRTTCLIYFWIGGPKAGSLPAVLTTIDVQTYALLQPPASHPSVAISPQISSQQASFSIPPPSVNSTSQALPYRSECTTGSVPKLTEGEQDFVDLPAPALLEGESDSPGKLAPGGGQLHPIAPTPAVENVPDEMAGRRSLRTLPRIDYKTFGDSGQKVPKDVPDEDAHNEAHCMCLLTLHGTETVHQPHTLKEAEVSPDWPEWKRAMDDEIAQLQKLGTYTPGSRLFFVPQNSLENWNEKRIF
ncbi:hypothetical protein BD414DRAFT_536416 [Trametes punicea]|nr:hypothetical protein BD414DRAFT_536416 [Trametes punicea]